MKSKRKKRKFYILTPDYEHVIRELSFTDMAKALNIGTNNLDQTLVNKKNLFKGKYPIAED